MCRVWSESEKEVYLSILRNYKGDIVQHLLSQHDPRKGKRAKSMPPLGSRGGEEDIPKACMVERCHPPVRTGPHAYTGKRRLVRSDEA